MIFSKTGFLSKLITNALNLNFLQRFLSIREFNGISNNRCDNKIEHPSDNPTVHLPGPQS